VAVSGEAQPVPRQPPHPIEAARVDRLRRDAIGGTEVHGCLAPARPTARSARNLATDYDTPRNAEGAGDTIEGLPARGGRPEPALVDLEDIGDAHELPAAADVLDEELIEVVVAMRADEFRCDRCFLVHHRSRLTTRRGTALVCADCA